MSRRRAGLHHHLRFEQSHEPLAPAGHFLRRWLLYWALAVLLVAVWLCAGTLLYLTHLHCSLHEAFYQASMIASGVGTDLRLPESAKIAVSLYAVFSGVVLLGSAGAFLSPIVHRIQHYFHIRDAG